MPVHVGAGSSAIQIQSPLGQDPSSGASAGDLYYNTTESAYKYYDGTRWKVISSETGYDGGVGNDPHYGNVSLHLKASEGILGDVNNFEKGCCDLSRWGQVVTEAPSVQIDTSNTKFENGCFRLDSTDGTLRYMRIDSTTNEGIKMRTNAFTWEGWFYINSSNSNINANYRLWQVGANSTGGIFMGYNSSNLYFGRTDETFMSHARSNYNDQWVHIAIVRDNSGGTLRWFRNGVQVATYSGSAWNWDMNSSADLYFGLFPGSTSSRRNGIRFDDFRITVGVARYTSNFTPPGLLPQYKQDTTTLGTRSNPATNAEEIRTSATNAANLTDGTYYIKSGTDVIRTWCEFNSMGGWMAIAFGDGSSTPIPQNSSERGTLALGHGFRGRLSDATINNMTWNYCWLGMTDNDADEVHKPSADGRCTMDPNRQLFSTSGVKFNVAFNANYTNWTSGSTDNGRNQTWSYVGTGGQYGTTMTGSTRQPSGNVINAIGVTDRTLGNTNTYGISPHEASDGGAWIHSQNGSSGNFNNGFGGDYNNVAWTSRYSYWFVK